MNAVHWSPDVAAAVAVMALFFIVTIGGAAVRHSRRKRRKFDASIARAEGQIRENRARSPLYAARHAATRPRTGDASAAVTEPQKPSDAPRSQNSGAGFGRSSQKRPRRVVTTADSIPPVIWPGPGTAIPVRPQPASHPGRRTSALDRLTDTGWMRAIEGDTNQYIHAMRYEAEQYRKGLRARPAADDARPDGPAPARAYGAGPLNDPGRIIFGEPRDRPEVLP